MTLPNGWKWTTIGELADINKRNPELRELPDDLSVTFVPMAAVDAYSGTITSPEIRPLGKVRKGYTAFTNGDVIFAKITPSMENGKAALAKDLENGLGFGSTEFHVMSPKDCVLANYLFYFIRQESFRQDAKAKFAGTAGQLRVPHSFIENYTIPLTPLPEQERIVARIEELFTQLDAGVASLRLVKAALKRYKASVLKAACEGRLVNGRGESLTRPGDEPANELLWRVGKKPLLRDDLPDLPEGWCWAVIDQIAETIGGLTKGRNFRDKKTIMLPYLRVANVQQGVLDLTEVKEIRLLETEIDKYKLENGDVVLTEGGDWDKLGRSAIWKEQIPLCVHQNHIFRARMYTGEILSEWLVYYNNSEQGRKYFSDASKQTTNLASINLTQLRNCPIPIPPYAEQQRIVAEVERRLSVTAQVEAAVQVGLKRAERLRQAIFKQAFEGRLSS